MQAKKRAPSQLEEALAFQLTALKIPFVREYKFARDAVGNPKTGIRKRLNEQGLKDWRFDFALPTERIAIEVEGGIFTGGRHTRGAGFREDCYKYNHALLLGWRVLRFTGQEIKRGEALAMIEKLLTKPLV